MSDYIQFGLLKVGQCFARVSRPGVWCKLAEQVVEDERLGNTRINAERLDDEKLYAVDYLYDETLIKPLSDSEAYKFRNIIPIAPLLCKPKART